MAGKRGLGSGLDTMLGVDTSNNRKKNTSSNT